MSRTVVLLTAVMLASCAGGRPAPATLTGDTRTHDPSMIRHSAAYYVFSTGDERGLNNGSIQIRSSSDMQAWELRGTVWEAIPDWVGAELGATPPNLWAPDIVLLNGTYHLYYAGSSFGSNNSVIGLATNTTLDPASPEYRWVDRGMVLRSTAADNYNAIDPSLVLDTAGVPWLAFGSFWDGIRLRRIDAASGMPSEEDPTLYRIASRGGGAIEAPAIVAHGGYYYLFVSFDNCCRGVLSTYRIMVGRSESISGPYADRAGRRMDQGGGDLVLEADERYRGPGGQSVVNDEGVYRLVYHGYDTTQNGLPQLQIRDIGWTDDGWPQLAPR